MISGGIIGVTEAGTATGAAESRNIMLKETFLRTDFLFTTGLEKKINMVLMKVPKPRGIFSIEMLPVDKWNYCAIVQKPV